MEEKQKTEKRRTKGGRADLRLFSEDLDIGERIGYNIQIQAAVRKFFSA